MSGQVLGEHDRQLANTGRLGTVAAVDLTQNPPLARVQIGELTTDWMPWVVRRAKEDSEFWAPEIGEQVAVMSLFGDPSQGVILGSIPQQSYPPPANAANLWRKKFKDGTTITYDRDSHTLTVDTIKAQGQVKVICKDANVEAQSTVNVQCTTSTVQASESVTLDTPLVHCTQALTVDGVFTYKGGMVGSGGTAAASISGPVSITGGSLTHNGKNVGSTHTHSGVQSGGSNTGAPV